MLHGRKRRAQDDSAHAALSLLSTPQMDDAAALGETSRLSPAIARPPAPEESKLESVSSPRSSSRRSGTVSHLMARFEALREAYGWRYCALVVSEYGANQGMGMSFVGTARSYYLLDRLGLHTPPFPHMSHPRFPPHVRDELFFFFFFF